MLEETRKKVLSQIAKGNSEYLDLLAKKKKESAEGADNAQKAAEVSFQNYYSPNMDSATRQMAITELQRRQANAQMMKQQEEKNLETLKKVNTINSVINNNNAQNRYYMDKMAEKKIEQQNKDFEEALKMDKEAFALQKKAYASGGRGGGGRRGGRGGYGSGYDGITDTSEGTENANVNWDAVRGYFGSAFETRENPYYQYQARGDHNKPKSTGTTLKTATGTYTAQKGKTAKKAKTPFDRPTLYDAMVAWKNKKKKGRK